jgi:transcriptional regulator with XRE-family HTH domain
VRRARERTGLTRDQLAVRAGVSPTSISQFEAGYQHPPLETIYLIAQVLGVDVHTLLPPLHDLTQASTDILGKVATDQSLNPSERDALLDFFRRRVSAHK